MRYIYSIVLLVCTMNLVAQNGDFQNHFKDGSLRMDVYHCGNKDTSDYYFDKFMIEKYWGGPQANLLENFGYGTNMVKVRDKISGKVIYSYSYCTLFQEWQTTSEAANINRCYEESVSVPLPVRESVVEIYLRNKHGKFDKVFSQDYNPDEIYVMKEHKYDFDVYDVAVNGAAPDKVDVVIIPDGYTLEEMDKFKSDCQNLVNVFKKFEPYSSAFSDFNFRAVLAPSDDSGTDVPRKNIWKRTIVDAHFDTFYSDRYNTTDSYFAVKDVASCVPYDQIYILVNSNIYGGGGIYNYYSVSTAGNISSDKVIIHEFGHAFAGLGDEYVEPGTSFDDMYGKDMEPWEPNLTTLIDFASKWQALVDKNTPVPTIPQEKYIDKTGVFEGAGYVEKGVYRPAYDCLMRTFNGNTFCEVCTKAIKKMIDFRTGKQ